MTPELGNPEAGDGTGATRAMDRVAPPPDRRRAADPWAAMPGLLADRFVGLGVTVHPSWDDYPRVAAAVRDDTAEHGWRGFRPAWPRVADRIGPGAVSGPARWETRCLAELAWFCQGGYRDPGFEVWDEGRLVRHRTRLRRLDLPVPDHHTVGEPGVWSALHWTAADLQHWEQMLAATGRLSAPAALANAVGSLVEAGCRGWPAAARDPDRLGGFDLVRPDGVGVAIDLTADDGGRTVCEVRAATAGRPGERTREVFDYAGPMMLVALTARLRDLGLDPRPPGWPLQPPANPA